MERNESVTTSFSVQDDGKYTVTHDGQEVARDLTQEEAAMLVGDISYYGRPMQCIFHGGVCAHPFQHCNICPNHWREEK